MPQYPRSLEYLFTHETYRQFQAPYTLILLCIHNQPNLSFVQQHLRLGRIVMVLLTGQEAPKYHLDPLSGPKVTSWVAKLHLSSARRRVLKIPKNASNYCGGSKMALLLWWVSLYSVFTWLETIRSTCIPQHHPLSTLYSYLHLSNVANDCHI